MSRKKVSKTKKIAAKKIKTAKHASPIQKMEKEFKAMPAKLIQQFRKELAALKKQENKRQSALKKLQKQEKSIDNKQTKLLAKSQTKPSAAINKQLKSIQKNIAKNDQAIEKLIAELVQISDQSAVLASKQNRLIAISKEIAQLDKKEKATSAAPKKSKKQAGKKVQPLIEQENSASIDDLIDSTLSEIDPIES